MPDAKTRDANIHFDENLKNIINQCVSIGGQLATLLQTAVDFKAKVALDTTRGVADKAMLNKLDTMLTDPALVKLKNKLTAVKLKTL